MMADNVALRECPFCGSTNVGWTHCGEIAQVFCKDCETEGPYSEMDGSDDDAMEKWNTRAPDPALAAKDRRITALGMELQDVRDRLDATRKSLLQRDKALDVQWERIAELEAEVAETGALRCAYAQAGEIARQYQQAVAQEFAAAQQRIAALEAEVARLQEERRAWVQTDTDNIRATLPRENP